MKKTLVLIALSLTPYLAHAGAMDDFINGARMSIDAESAVTSAISKCNIQSDNSKISFGLPCETYLNNANSYLFNLPNKQLSVKWRRKVVKYANSHHIKLDPRFTADL